MKFVAQAFRGRKVLVTGHTGFKGSWLVSWLSKLGAEVCGFSLGIPTEPSMFELNGLAALCRHELGDIRDRARLDSVIRDFRPDIVFHLAAQAIVSTSYREPLETMSVNALGTATLLDCLRFVDWRCVAVVITSDKAYDNVEWPWGYRESDRLGGKDVYSGSKGAAELAFYSYLHSFFVDSGSPVCMATARAGNVIGGGDWAADRIVADCVRAWSSNRTVQVRSPKATRPWQHVLEPLSGYLTLAAKLAADSKAHGQSYNFGPRAEQNATVVELMTSLARFWGFPDPRTSYDIVEHRPFHEASLLKLNVDKALLELAWTPTLSYSECVEMTGSWYRDVLRLGAPGLDVTKRQIEEYERLAGQRGAIWAAEV